MLAFLAGLAAAHPVVAGASALALVGGGSAAALAAIDQQPPALVQSVVDGDTIRVSRGDDSFKVRLLNINTPESVDPDKPVECMALEATAFLKQRLPAGTPVQLEYDEQRQDRYGRDLAGVFVDGILVNAEIARAGLGAAVLYGDNDRFFDEVLAAQAQAESNHVGLYSPEVACTLPAQVLAYENKAARAGQAPAPAADLAALDARGEALDSLADEGAALLAVLASSGERFPMAAFTGPTLSALRSQLQGAVASARDLRRGNEQARAAEVERQRVAAEEEAAARRQAEEDARESAASAAAAAAPQQSASSTAGDGGPAQPTGGGEPWNSPGPDLDCADIGHQVSITGADYHGLDRDGDGVGCESYG
jgi:micrococcal nuclease